MLLASSLFFGCKKDKTEAKDPRDQVAGLYHFADKTLIHASMVSSLNDTTVEDAGTLIISKEGTDKLIFLENNLAGHQFTFYANSVSGLTSITFTIPTQMVESGGATFPISGSGTFNSGIISFEYKGTIENIPFDCKTDGYK